MMAAGTVTADGRARVLADGNEIPLVGLGVWQVPNGRECEDAVRWALEAGYRHGDTAPAYGNERRGGRGRACVRCPTGASVRTRCAGRWRPATATSTLPRPTATSAASAVPCATAASLARTSLSRRSSTRGAAT